MTCRLRLTLALVLLCTLVTATVPAADGGFRTLDLKPIVNMDWRAEVWGDGKGGWTDQGDNDLRQITVGRRELLGIPFELIDPATNGNKAVLKLGSKKFPAGPVSASTLGPMSAPAGGLPVVPGSVDSAGAVPVFGAAAAGCGGGGRTAGCGGGAADSSP